jgi:hypothetical protein
MRTAFVFPARLATQIARARQRSGDHSLSAAERYAATVELTRLAARLRLERVCVILQYLSRYFGPLGAVAGVIFFMPANAGVSGGTLSTYLPMIVCVACSALAAALSGALLGRLKLSLAERLPMPDDSELS